MLEQRKFLTVITGPTCSGKSTLQKLLSARGFEKVVTTTTREPRPGERDGLDYHFVTKEDFLTGVKTNEFFEAEEFDGKYYGITKAALAAAFEKSNFCTVITEPNGVESVILGAPLDINVKTITLHTPRATLIKRITERFGEGEKRNKRCAGLAAEFDQMSFTPSYGRRVISPTNMKQLETFADHYDPRNGHLETQTA